jgi:phosphohistidine phosphatase
LSARLLIVRHGRAAPAGPAGDEERQLTDEGRRELIASCRALGRLQIRPSLILSSPYLRTRQTSDILAAELGSAIRAEVRSELASGANPDAFFEILEGCDDDLVAVVGHMPDVAELVAAATGTPCNFEPGGMALLDDRAAMRFGRARLLEVWSPARLGVIGEASSQRQ